MIKQGFLRGCLGLGAVLLVLLFSACDEPSDRSSDKKTFDAKAASAALVHDAYIWQRVWTSAVGQAVQEATPVVRQWRILAAQTSSKQQLRQFEPDWQVLATSGKPVLAVVRIDGQLQDFDQDEMRTQMIALYQAWLLKGAEYGVAVVGLEVDYDCGTQRLIAYAGFLQHLKKSLHAVDKGKGTLSITALPDWLNAQELEDVLAAVDYSVLQVHSVVDPAQGGLFNAQVAKHWVKAYARRSAESGQSFLVALPNYGSRVSWDRNGRITAVTSEAPIPGGGVDAQGSAQELFANPQEISNFLQQGLDYQAMPELKGVAWFRLPTAQDERSWAMPTWLAVMRGEPLRARVGVALVPSPDDAAFYRVVLQNTGEVDVVLPARVNLPKTCTYADGVRANGYTLQYDDAKGNGVKSNDTKGGAMFLQKQDQSLLKAGQQSEIGWARCPVNVNMDLPVQNF